MIKFYENLFNIRQCEHIANGMLSKHTANAAQKDNTYAFGSHGFYDLAEAVYYVPMLTKLIKRDYGNVVFKNNFTRIYFNGNELKIHTDRQGLDITLSVCIFSNINYQWPIYVSNVEVNGPWKENLPIESYVADSTPYFIPVGSGVACLGTRNPHWREPLVCDRKQMVIQAFYHWAFS